MAEGMSQETREQLLEVLGEAAAALMLLGVLVPPSGQDGEVSMMAARVAAVRSRLIAGESGTDIQECLAAFAVECGSLIGTVLSSQP